MVPSWGAMAMVGQCTGPAMKIVASFWFWLAVASARGRWGGGEGIRALVPPPELRVRTIRHALRYSSQAAGLVAGQVA